VSYSCVGESHRVFQASRTPRRQQGRKISWWLMTRDDRRSVWIDDFQTHLVFRICLYLTVFLLVLMNLVFAWRLASEGPGNVLAQFNAMLLDYLPVMVCLLVLVPVLAWDAIRFTHRLVGPLVRFRQVVKRLARGEAVERITLRQDDFLIDLQDDFNAMLESLQKRGAAVLAPRKPPTDAGTQRETA
jgi:methyl-accepting chemotaxis protein